MAELVRRSKLRWDEEPNLAPCMSWKRCGRRYEVVEYDAVETPWREVRRQPVLEINASGVTWLVAVTGGVKYSHLGRG